MDKQRTHWGEHLIGKTFTVQNYFPVITIGSKVTWRVDSRRKNGHVPFTANGRVVKLYPTTFGGSIKKQGAKIETEGRYLEVFPGRMHTTVAIDKLKLDILPSS